MTTTTDSNSPPVSPLTSSRKRSHFATRLMELSFLLAALMFALRAYSKSFLVRKPDPPDASRQISVVKKEVRSDIKHHDTAKSLGNATSVTGTTPSNLKVAWLMSFPNSGTSYTLVMVRNSSRTAVGTNYGQESETWDENGNSIPVFNRFKGPFWISPADVDLPTKVVLTKTHCVGACIPCSHSKFLLQCRSGAVWPNDNNNKKVVLYGEEIVAKAIHLIRHPLDNIVARFHFYIKNLDVNKTFVNTKAGFRSYCLSFDRKLRHEGGLDRYVDEQVLKLFERVPCHFDLIHYANWHDRAFLATDEMNVPTYVLHYENYSHNFNKTQAEILDFLHLEQRGEPPLFIKGKQYKDYFSQQEHHAAKVALKALASDRTWQHIQHYFGTDGEASMVPM